MKRTATALLVVSVLALTLGPAVGPAWSRDAIGRGDFDFYLDTAAFRGREGRVVAEVSVRIPNSEIRFAEAKGEYESHLKFSVLITDLDGNPVVEDAEEMRFEESEAARINTSLYFQTVIRRYHITPGVYLLSYAIQDLNAPKRTLVGMTRGKFQTSAVRRVRFDLPEIPPDAPAFSQAKFVWDIETAADGSRVYHPNPPRVYGLYNDTLTVYMELYLPDSLAKAPEFSFQSVIVNGEGEEAKATAIRLPNPGTGVEEGVEAYPILLREDLTRITAGTYTLYVSFYLGAQRLSRVRAGRFSVAWDLRTWEVPRRELMAEARFLLGDEKFAEFRSQPVGDQEQALDEEWKKLDPTPESSVNEAYEMFIARLDFVNEHYGDHGPAVFDPRGQLFMRLGEPDEIVQDVIPLNRETLSEALQMIEDRFHAMSFSNHGVKLYHKAASRNEVLDSRGLATERAGDNVAYPFELWIYHAKGEPILARDSIQEMDIGMRYLFIDREGYGRYKLESSSSISTK